jgi:hypothetical protein
MHVRFASVGVHLAWVFALTSIGCNGGSDDGFGDSYLTTQSTSLGDTGPGDGDSGDGDSGDGDGDSGDGDGDTTTGDGDGDTTTGDGDGDTTTGDGDGDGDLVPPAGQSSGGSGGGAAAGTPTQANGISYYLIAPGSAGPYPLLIVYSGVEGAGTMTQNLLMVQDFVGASNFVIAVLDGVTYNGNGDAGATVLDGVRQLYDIDNDRTYLLSESAGTTAGLELGLDLRQSYFAAYWANDVNASAGPSLNAAQLGFQPYGNAGPGGDFPDANAIVSAMMAADYRTPPPAPYDGPGSGSHGDPNQFIAAMQWFPGKTRQ